MNVKQWTSSIPPGMVKPVVSEARRKEHRLWCRQPSCCLRSASLNTDYLWDRQGRLGDAWHLDLGDLGALLAFAGISTDRRPPGYQLSPGFVALYLNCVAPVACVSRSGHRHSVALGACKGYRLLWLHLGLLIWPWGVGLPCLSANQLRPVLKAIDPSLARIDKPTPSSVWPPAVSGIRGVPVPSSSLDRSDGGFSIRDAGSMSSTSTPRQLLPNSYTGGSPLQNSSFPTEQQIPDFGGPLPAGAGNYDGGQGFLTPPSPTNQSSYNSPMTFAGGQPVSGDEQTVGRLEVVAFGSTYPEHEIADRVDHLESEVFGKTETGALADRLVRLQERLLGRGAFSQPTALSPAMMTSTPLATAVRAPANSGYQSPEPAWDGPEVGADRQAEMPVTGNARPDDLAGAGGQMLSMAATGRGTMPSVGLQATIAAIPYYPKAGDYLNAVRRFSGWAVARWKSFPVRLHLPAGTPQSWQSDLETGMKRWSQYVPLQSVSPDQPADVDVLWVNNLPQRELGITRLLVVSGEMHVKIYLLRPTLYTPLIPEKMLSSVFLHELGHALGIWGHSDCDGDIMEPMELLSVARRLSSRGVPVKMKIGGISRRDVNTLKRIYETPGLPPGFTLSHPLDWADR